MSGNSDIVANILRDLRLGFGLLTRLPLPGEPDLTRGAAAAWAWPLAGLAPGVLGALSLWLLSGLGAGVAAAVALAVMVMSTGAMHEDGLADTADGLWGGWDRDRRLEIMKDSRIGAYGVIALILSLLARWSLLVALIGAGEIWWPLLAAAILSRLPMLGLMVALPAAREGGLSRLVGQPEPRALWIALAVALPLCLLLSGWGVIWALAASSGVAALLGFVAMSKIGGQTGDILGAGQQLAEITCLALLVACLS